MKTKAVLLIISAVLMLYSTFGYAENSSKFSDLSSDHWAYPAVMDMVSKGVLSGFDDGTFRPNAPVTREQFAKILVLAYGVPFKNPYTPTFDDITKDKWSYQYVETVKQYLTGYKDGNKLYFRGDRVAVREDMAVAIIVAKGLSSQTPDLSQLDKYTDKEDISASLRGYLAIAVKNKVMEGDGRTFNPQGTLTRAEACALIYKSSIATSKETKIAVIDENYGKDYKVYNDGNVTFNYPSEYVFEVQDVSADTPLNWFTFKNMPASKASQNGVDITIKYTTQYADYDIDAAGGTTLDETYKLADKMEGSSAEANGAVFKIEKYGNCVVTYSSIIGQSDEKNGEYRIYARGIGEAVPYIKVSNFDASYNGDINNSFNRMERVKNQIVKTLNVINTVQPINKTKDLDKTKVFNDGNITFEYPSEYNFQTNISSEAVPTGAQYSQSADVSIMVSYETDIPLSSKPVDRPDLLDTTLEGVKAELLKYYDSSQVAIYENYILLNWDAPAGNFKYIIGRGIKNKIPVIQIHDVNLDNPAKGKQEAKRVVKQIVSTIKVISRLEPIQTKTDAAAPKVISTTPTNGATGVDNRVTILINFSEPIQFDTEKISFADTLGRALYVNKANTWLDGLNTIKMASGGIEPGETYIIKFEKDSIKDLAGNCLSEPYTFTFTTSNANSYLPPTASVGSGTYNQPIEVSFNDTGYGVWGGFIYTLDGSEPSGFNGNNIGSTKNWNFVPIKIEQTTILKVKAFKINQDQSYTYGRMSAYTYIIVNNSEAPIEQKYKVFNDNLVTFEYKSDVFFGSAEETSYTYDKRYMGKYGRSADGIIVYSLRYLPVLEGLGGSERDLQDTTLDGVYKAAVDEYGASYVQKTGDIIIVSKNNSIKILGRGIGKVVPSLTIWAFDNTYDTNELNRRNLLVRTLAEKAKNTFRVIATENSVSDEITNIIIY